MRKSISTAIALCMTVIMGAFAQTTQPLPLDPNVRMGVLENGLTYYIRHNEEPKERAEFHIAQGVGAILEEDNQNGLAHFLEHMAFNGTQHFPGKGIINYFESIGVNFGGNINAYTSLDETVYRLSDVPTIRPGIIDNALLVMRDWSCGLLLEDDEIDAERGVIREEWRTGANANRRLWKESNKLKYAGSQYAKRDVIGDTAVINNFSYDALRDYYKKWYGPDLQAIVVVGDINVDSIEAKIKQLWADVPARANRGERPIYDIPDNQEPIVAIATDKEAQFTRIELEYKHNVLPDSLQLTMTAYTQDVLNDIVSRILNYRFSEITQKPDASFVGAYGFYGELVKAKDAFQLIAVPKEGHEKQALTDLLIEAEKVKRFGFTNSELERAKAEMLTEYETDYNERNNQRNIDLTRDYIRHYLDKTCTPGIEWEFQMLQVMLPQINIELLNRLAQNYVIDNNLIISFTAPEKETVKLPTKEEALAQLADVKAMELTAPKEETIDKKLVTKTPKRGKIKVATTNKSLGTTEWTLSNGVKVIIKPTTFKKDEILLTGFSRGGLSKIEKTNDLLSAMFAVHLITSSGIGNFTAIELEKYLAGKNVSVAPEINSFSEELNGNSSVKDFETMLQLVYLYFTAPRKDDEAIQAQMNIYKTVLANKESNPKAIFGDSIQMTMSNHHPRTILLNIDMLTKVDADKALTIYKERFATPADFTFMLVGNIDPNDPATKKLICTWIGGLKSKKVHENFIDHGVRTPKGKVLNYFEREMQTHTASNRIAYTGEMKYNLTNKLNMDAIGRILDIRYLESIREREGGSYGVGVAGFVSDKPTEQATLLMQFDTDPEKQTKLMEIIHQEVAEIVKDGPRMDDLIKVKESMLKDFAEDIEKNNWWQNTALYNFYINNIDYYNDYKAAVTAISSESIKATLTKLVEQGNVVEVVMSPKQ